MYLVGSSSSLHAYETYGTVQCDALQYVHDSGYSMYSTVMYPQDGWAAELRCAVLCCGTCGDSMAQCSMSQYSKVRYSASSAAQRATHRIHA
jgi:hypothetical protein